MINKLIKISIRSNTDLLLKDISLLILLYKMKEKTGIDKANKIIIIKIKIEIIIASKNFFIHFIHPFSLTANITYILATD